MEHVLWFAGPLLLLAAAGPVCLAQADDWERVKLIQPGKTISVVLQKGDSFDARLKEWTPDGISVLRRRDRVQEIAKPDVRKISLVVGMHPAKRAGWAALVGGGVGFAFWAGLCAATNCEFLSTMEVGAAGGMFVGAISAGVAALIPRHREKIYEVSPATRPGKKKK